MMSEFSGCTEIPSAKDALAGVGLRDALNRRERELLEQLPDKCIPRHIAIIMDGNGRWAKQAGFMERIRGHEAGVDSVRAAVRACGELHVQVLTLYAFSVENWKRPEREIGFLMSMLEKFLRQEIDELNAGNVRLRVSGRVEDLPQNVRLALDNAIAATSGNTGLILNLALSYGGRTEIARAARLLAARVEAGEMRAEEIDEVALESELYTAGLPDPDLLIRTSGEMRVSNFLLWQIAYTEIYVTPVFWPEFRRIHLYEALLEYSKRDRRFGGLK